MKLNLDTYKPAQLLLIGFAMGAVIFGLIGWLIPIPSPFGNIERLRGTVLRQSSADYKYITPLLACEIGTESAFPELNPVKSAVNDAIQENIRAGNAADVSVYFRELNTARWFEINGNDTYAPASLLKVFVMMAYYKSANETDNPGLLQEVVPFEGSTNPAADTPGEIIPHLTAGRRYTVDQLIDQMIIYSDNDALNTLIDHFDPQTINYFELIFKDLNIPSPVTQKEDSFNFMSPDQYALVFRVLFSSTYLSERYSEKALGLLSQAHYKNALVAGVPAGITVAHKFGDTTVSGSPELHDCGIVYLPNHPYLLCVMTKGANFAGLQTSIQAVSAAAYAQFSSLNSK